MIIRRLRFSKSLPFLIVPLCSAAIIAEGQSTVSRQLVHDRYGAIVRGDVSAKRLALVFTGDEYGESTAPILAALKQRKIKAAFFVTGKFLRQTALRRLLERAIAEGHYIGPHSDSHPLYASWDDRKKSLVSEEFFKTDLQKNIDEIKKLGGLKKGEPVYFIPPYEHFNGDQVRWSHNLNVNVINFTPGTGSNRDYAKEDDSHFVRSQRICDDILVYEQKDPHGLRGFILLLHLGSGRKDPFHPLLGQLCDELSRRKYQFVRIDSLLSRGDPACLSK
jgi:peptidoglycan/xylan/chitin deacetylase (PgdA/CDA1 family)